MRGAATLAALVLLAGCGADEQRAQTAPAGVDPDAGNASADIEERAAFVGLRERGAWVLRPPEASPDARVPTVVFLHGWSATDPETYGPWLAHLLDRGEQVVFPIYQASVLGPPEEALGNAAAGVRAALARYPAGRLVVAGHSAGGALAGDLAAGARGLGIPQPRAVLAADPGRSIGGLPALLPEVDPRGTPDDVPVLALAGEEDRVVGTRWARRAARAPAGRYELITDDAVDDHLAPQRADPASRRTFWAPLDQLLGATSSPPRDRGPSTASITLGERRGPPSSP